MNWVSLAVTLPLPWWVLIWAVIVFLIVVAFFGARAQFRVDRHLTSEERYADHSLSAERDAWFDEKGVEHKYREGTPLSKGEKPWVIPPIDPGEPPHAR